MASTAPQEPHVLIIGAGLTGLLIAQGLKKAGISFEIFESEAEGTFRPREWTMGVHWGVPLIEQLLPEELASKIIEEASVDKSLDYVTPPTNGSRIYDGLSGEVLKELVSEGRLIRVSRRKLRGLISRGIDVKFSHKLTSLTPSDPATSTITAHFSNSSSPSATGTLLVGADGPKSLTRDLLFPPDILATGFTATKPLTGIIHLTSTFSYGDAKIARYVRENSHPVWSMMIHPRLFTYICIQDVPDPTKPEDWVFFAFACWLGERSSFREDEIGIEEAEKAAWEEAKTRAKEIQEPFKTAILSVPESAPRFRFVDVGFWPSTPFPTLDGRATLAGDAAHPMPPYRGQGLNHAIQDAWNFVEAVKKVRDGGVGQEEGVEGYSEEVVKRGGEEVVMSTKNAYMMLAYEDFLESPYMKIGLSRGK